MVQSTKSSAKKRIQLVVTPEDYRRLKAVAALRGQSMSAFVAAQAAEAARIQLRQEEAAAS